jgi:hypothetical protein
MDDAQRVDCVLYPVVPKAPMPFVRGFPLGGRRRVVNRSPSPSPSRCLQNRRRASFRKERRRGAFRPYKPRRARRTRPLSSRSRFAKLSRQLVVDASLAVGLLLGEFPFTLEMARRRPQTSGSWSARLYRVESASARSASSSSRDPGCSYPRPPAEQLPRAHRRMFRQQS